MRWRLAQVRDAGRRPAAYCRRLLRALSGSGPGRRFLRRRAAGPVAVGLGLMAVLAAFTWSCQTLTPALDGGPRLLAEPDINIRIRRAADKVEITGPRLVYITEPAAAMLQTPVVITRAPSGLMVSEAGGPPQVYPPALEMRSGAPRAAGVEPTLTVDGTAYPGRIRVLASGGSGEAALAGAEARPPTIDVVASMGLETYLPGVLAKELPGGWPAETNRVQAVCARSYALHQRDRARAQGRAFDVESSTLDQVYIGTTTRHEALDAVRATRGQILEYNGLVLRAYYSSTCGGRSASAAEVWPIGPGYEFNRAGPIQGRERISQCQASPVYRWEVRRDRAELEQRFRAWGAGAGSPLKSIGRLASIEVARVSATGRPSRYAVIDASGRRVELSAEELRVACNTEAPGVPAPDRKILVRSGDFQAAVVGESVVFTGRGFGHGVGMCQYCAKGLAERGLDYKRMLGLFYPGARLEKAY